MCTYQEKMLYSPWQMSHTTKTCSCLFFLLFSSTSTPPELSLSIYLSFLNIAFPQTPLCSARFKCRVDPAIPLPITSRQIRLLLSYLALHPKHTQRSPPPECRSASQGCFETLKPSFFVFFPFEHSKPKPVLPIHLSPLRKNANLSLKIRPVESCTETYKRKKMDKKKKKKVMKRGGEGGRGEEKRREKKMKRGNGEERLPIQDS